jgi:hypothetical protein
VDYVLLSGISYQRMAKKLQSSELRAPQRQRSGRWV